jgi:hypothetical protein
MSMVIVLLTALGLGALASVVVVCWGPAAVTVVVFVVVVEPFALLETVVVVVDVDGGVTVWTAKVGVPTPNSFVPAAR